MSAAGGPARGSREPAAAPIPAPIPAAAPISAPIPAAAPVTGCPGDGDLSGHSR